jgi:hypothetical protein
MEEGEQLYFSFFTFSPVVRNVQCGTVLIVNVSVW